MKTELNHQALEVFYEDDNGFSEKREFNSLWEEVYYENSNGEIRDNRISYYLMRDKVQQWAKDKGILDKATPTKQADKTIEEAVELKVAIETNNKAEIIDALGDILVTIIIQAKMQNIELMECLERAYRVIENRTGKMINGQFVKNEG